MTDLFSRLRGRGRQLAPELWLGIAVLLLAFWRFGGFWRGEPMPHGDWPGQEQAALDMAACLQSGHWDCLMKGQLGGVPLFQLYAPLFFIVSAGLWLLSLKTLSLFLILRGLVFLGVLAAVPALWYFTRAFLGERAARWSIAFSPLFVFYPMAHAVFGIGGASAAMVGMAPSTFGPPLVLVLLGAVKEIVEGTRPRRAWWLAVGAGAALILTHTLSMVFGVALSVPLLAVLAVRRPRPALSVVGAAAAATGLAAFWLLPFLAYSGVASGYAIVDALQTSWWHGLFTADVVMGKPLAVMTVAGLAGGAAVALAQRRWPYAAVLGSAWALFLARHQLQAMMPGAVIHYYRFSAILNLLDLSAIAAVFAWLELAAADRLRHGRAYVIIVAAVISLMGVFLLDANYLNEQNGERILSMQLKWSGGDYPGTAVVDSVLKTLGEQGGVGRFFYESPELYGEAFYGSAYEPGVRLATALGAANINGLFVMDSALTTPIAAVTDGLNSSLESLKGREYVRYLKAFREQSLTVHFARLADLGVTHVVFTSPEKAALVRRQQAADEVASTPDYAAFRLRAPRPLVSAAAHRPLVFASHYGRLSFDDLSQALYAGVATHDTLVVEETEPANAWDKASAERFAGVIVDAAGLSASDWTVLKAVGLPIIALNAEGAAVPGVQTIEAFEPVVRRHDLHGRDWPAGWEELWRDVAALREANRLTGTAVPVLLRDDSLEVSFRTDGNAPAIVNYSYFPTWRTVAGASRVYRATPGRLLVFPDGPGEVTLAYGRTPLHRLGLGVSLVTALALGVLAWRDRRRGRKP